MYYASIETHIPHNSHQMETIGRFSVGQLFRRISIYLANGDRDKYLNYF